jgi:hypothetical protein
MSYPIEFEECDLCGALLTIDRREIGICDNDCLFVENAFEIVRRREQIEAEDCENCENCNCNK